jgi:hypothetical protein
MKIQVSIKTVYGTERIYPVCDKAKVFANLVDQTTLSRRHIQLIKSLGYQIELVNGYALR